MKPPARLSACLFVATLPVAAGGLLCLVWSMQSAGEAHRGLEDRQRINRELDGRMARLQSIRAAKSELAAAVVAGHLRLFEVAAEFRALDARNPDFHWEMFRRTYRGDSDGERYCRMVMRYAENLLLHHPAQAEAVLFRLEAELQAHLLEHGTVNLSPL